MNPHAPATLRDIALALQLSHTTVSRALADHPRISARTKVRVKAMALSMGYIPNGSARSMRDGQSAAVGLIIPDVQNDFFSSVAKIVADTLAANGMQLMLSVTEDNPDRELRELRALIEARPGGVIIVPTAAPQAETLAILNAINTVQLVRMHPRIEATAVLIDDQAGTLEAARHLLDAGHRALAYLGGPSELNTGHDRLAGFQLALRQRGLAAAYVALGPPRPEFARQAITAMMALDPRPTALVLGSAELTLGALQALHAAAVAWPRDLSIVGYHDPAWFELVQGGITTLRLPVQQIAATATGALLAQRLRPAPSILPPASIRFPPTLILRHSTSGPGKQ